MSHLSLTLPIWTKDVCSGGVGEKFYWECTMQWQRCIAAALVAPAWATADCLNPQKPTKPWNLHDIHFINLRFFRFFSPWTLLQVNSHGGPAQSKCRRNVATIWRSHWTDSKTSCLASTVQVPRSVAFHQFTPGKCAHRIPRRKVLKWMLLRLRFTRFDGGTQNRISCGLPDEI